MSVNGYQQPGNENVSQFTPLSVQERHQILIDWNDTQTRQPQQSCVHHLVEAQVERTPSAMAVVYEDTQLTYEELNNRANKLAHYLISLGVGPDQIVAISLDRSMDLVVSVLAVLKAGGAYLPLDPAYPQDRIQYMLQDSQAHVLITAVSPLTPFPENQSIPIHLDTDWEKIDLLPATNPQTTVTIENLIYVIYTSGSTGNPKGVALPHRALANLIPWQLKNSALGLADKTLQFASLSFDVSCQEIFSTWCSGGTLVLISEDIRRDALRLLPYVAGQQAARLFLPFIALQQLAEAAAALNLYPASLREIITAGEQLQVNPYISAFFQALPDCILVNQYGPSETHVVTAYELSGPVQDWPALPPIGRPIDNTQIYLLDGEQQPVPPGAAGELYIGGQNVARGYLNQPELTAKKFIPDPFGKTVYATLYRTGDLARFLPDGDIEFLGRIDHQVKIRGFRVELGEIETCLSTHPALRQAVVTAREDTPGDKRLVAYLVTEPAHPLNPADLRQFLLEKMPEYMVPAHFVVLDAMPKTPSGKIDRRALPAPNAERPFLSQSFVAPQTDLEKLLAAVWSQILKIDQIGIDDNFFELGGSSILTLRIATQLKEAKGLEIPAVKLFEYPTIKALAAFLERDGLGNPDPASLFGQALAAPDTKRVKSAGIAIIGMALRLPGANNVDELWQLLSEGRATTTFFTDDDIDRGEPETLRRQPDYVKANGVIADADKFDAAFFGVNPRIAQVTDPQHRVFLELAWAALEDAGYDPDQFAGDIGLYVGMGENTYRRKQVEQRPDLIKAVGEFQVMLGNEKDYVATHTSYKLNLTGPSISLATACSTSLVAIIEAYKSPAQP
jgi:amino acid adenylation domain-containing protein